jgi:hypothetical protein
MNDSNPEIQMIDEEDFVLGNDEYAPDDLDFAAADETLTSKWTGCANHTLQLPLKILEKDAKFVKIRNAIVDILRTIRRSSIALQKLRELTNLSIILPIATR